MGDNPERLNGEASFAALCGVSPHRVLLRPTAHVPAQPRRRPPGRRHPAPHRLHPPAPRPAYPGVLRTPHPGGQDPARDHPMPQAIRSPRGLEWSDRFPAPPRYRGGCET
ncbi:hypothetical protein [Streptomyces sp. NBC_01723]|uniref:hypothetical protein n=1 Tax=unclassified Streptomyces TaxID=2593676 RepID=UPI002E32BB53|nr:hypothetical protein [Streptomyces sp. NBC_01723]